MRVWLSCRRSMLNAAKQRVVTNAVLSGTWANALTLPAWSVRNADTFGWIASHRRTVRGGTRCAEGVTQPGPCRR